jgi:hypothetical protein
MMKEIGTRPHIVDGQFQSDKYPTCPPGKVPLSVKDPLAQDLLWEYAARRRHVDAEFSADLEWALDRTGYILPAGRGDADDDDRVAAERARCVMIVRDYLSPRAGIMLSRRPGSLLKEILDRIMSGEPPPAGRGDG